MHVDTSDIKELRKFGVVMAVAITVLGAIRWAIHGFGPIPWAFLAVAGVFLVLGLALPRVLQPVFWAWMKFSLALNWVMTRVLLTVAFIFLITPAHVILWIKRKDLLNREWDPEAVSYWEDPEDQPEEFERYRQQF